MKPSLVKLLASGGRPRVGAWPRLRANRRARIGTALVVVLFLACVFGPLLSPWSFDYIDLDGAWSAPPTLAAHHFFGTDALGRDLFVRTLVGGQVSLLVGLVATITALGIGVTWGVTSGYLGGRIDALMMRVVDVLYALPFLLLAILLMVAFGRHFALVFAAIGAIIWLDMARIVRGQTLALRRRPFIDAAIVSGLGPAGIIRRHLLPNLLGVVAVYATLTVPQAIMIEAFLSFLGLGVQEPATSWGALINDGGRELTSAPWALIFPVAFLALTLLAFNLLGDGLRDALDPQAD